MPDRRDEILNESHQAEVEKDGIQSISSKHFPLAYKDAAINAMDVYSKEWERKYQEANQFICDLGKLIGFDGLGYDDINASIEDFIDFIDEKKKEMCLELLEYLAKNRIACGIYSSPDGELFQYKGHYITKEQLFENFL